MATTVKRDLYVEFHWANSPHPLYLSHALVEQLGGEAELLAALRCDLRMMPRRCSKQRPWTPLDWELMCRNENLGQRRWRYNPSCIVGDTRYYGYGYDTEKGFQFCNWNPERPSGNPISGRETY